MATNITPGLRKKGRFWHYSLMINGQRVHGSTRASDLATAKTVLEEKRKELLNGQCGVITRIPTLAEITKEWLRVHQRVHSRKHLLSVEQHTRIWILPALGTTRIDRIRAADVFALRSRMLGKEKSITTVNNAQKVLKLIVGYGLKMGYLDHVPFHLPMLRVQKKPRPVLPAVRVQEFFSQIDQEARNSHIPVLVRVMVGLGLRESEALGMRWEWFNLAQRTYVVGKAKGKEARVIPVPSWLWDAIHAMPKTLSEWVFPADDGKPHRAQFCKKVLQRVCSKMGLGNVTQHRLRATFASLHAEAGTPITEIQGMLGHKSVTTTMIYVEQSLESKRRSQDALSQRLGLA